MQSSKDAEYTTTERKKFAYLKASISRSITNRIDIFAFDGMNENEQIIIIFRFPEHTSPKINNKTKHQRTHFGWRTEPISYLRFSPHYVKGSVCGTWIEMTQLVRPYLIHSSLHSACGIALLLRSATFRMFAVCMHKYTLTTLPQVRLPYLFTACRSAYLQSLPILTALHLLCLRLKNEME